MIPICQSELGPDTEYGRLEVGPDGDLSADPKGSTDRNELRTCSLVTLIPRDLVLPYRSETQANGFTILMSCISDLRLASLMCVWGSSTSPYSIRLLK